MCMSFLDAALTQIKTEMSQGKNHTKNLVFLAIYPKYFSAYENAKVCKIFIIFPNTKIVNEDVLASFNWDPRGMQITKRIENQISCDILLPKWYKTDVFLGIAD